MKIFNKRAVASADQNHPFDNTPHTSPVSADQIQASDGGLADGLQRVYWWFVQQENHTD